MSWKPITEEEYTDSWPLLSPFAAAVILVGGHRAPLNPSNTNEKGCAASEIFPFSSSRAQR